MATVNAKQAAEILGRSVKTLEHWRLVGGGPIYCKIGKRVTYETDDLAAFKAAHRRTSTSDPGPAEPRAA